MLSFYNNNLSLYYVGTNGFGVDLLQ